MNIWIPLPGKQSINNLKIMSALKIKYLRKYYLAWYSPEKIRSKSLPVYKHIKYKSWKNEFLLSN